MLIAIFLLGTLLRILATSQHDFWYDEAFTYFVSKLPLKDLLTVTQSDANPPLYYILMHYVIALGKGEIILRLPSLLAGIATIILTFSLVNKFINKYAALPAAAFVSLSPLTIYLSTEARPHSLGIFFATLVVFTFLSLIKRPTLPNSGLFIGATAIGLYTHYYIGLLLIPFTFILVIKNGSLLSLKRWFILVLLCSAALLPWTITTLGASHNKCWCPRTVVSLPASLVSPVASGVGMVTLRTFPELPKAKFLFLTLTSLLTLIYFVKGTNKSLFLTATYFGPLLIMSTIGIFTNIFSPKAFSIFSPIYLSILALGVHSSSHKKLLIPILLLFLGTISIWQSQDGFFKGDRLKLTYGLLKTKDIPIIHTSATTYYPLKYYTGDNGQNFLIGENPLNPSTVNYIEGQRLQTIPQTDTMWVIDNNRWDKTGQKSSEAKANLLTTYNIDSTYQFDSITVSYLKRKN